MNKIRYEDGKEFYETPYKSMDRRGRPSTQMLIYKEELKKKEEVERLKRENYVVMKVDEDLIEHINELREKGQQPATLIQCTMCKELKEQVGTLEQKLEQLSKKVEEMAASIAESSKSERKWNVPEKETER